jgi:hypothetical protein
MRQHPLPHPREADRQIKERLLPPRITIELGQEVSPRKRLPLRISQYSTTLLVETLKIRFDRPLLVVIHEMGDQSPMEKPRDMVALHRGQGPEETAKT